MASKYVKSNKLNLVRYGGLSFKRQHHYTADFDAMPYHGAPERYGIYAFMFGRIDWWLLSGTDKLKDNPSTKNKRSLLNCTVKKFSVDGFVWTHVKPHEKFKNVVVDQRGSWYKIHSKDFVKVYKKEYALMTGEYIQAQTTEYDGSRLHDLYYTVKNPYRNVSTDHLEIFVPRGTKITNI